MNAKVRQFFSDLRNGPYAWPGGYPVFYTTTDGGCLCHGCARTNVATIGRSTRDGCSDGWEYYGCDINYEDPSLFCDNCGNRIESAYCEDDIAAAAKLSKRFGVPVYLESAREFVIDEGSSRPIGETAEEAERWLLINRPAG